MAYSVRRSASRNYSGQNAGKDEIDSALDDLGGFSYLDGIPFELDRGIKSALDTAQIHINRADALLARPLPVSVSQASNVDNLLADVGRIEKEVLKQLKQIESEREERKAREKAIIKEYEEQKEKEIQEKQAQSELNENANEKNVADANDKGDDEYNNESVSTNPDSKSAEPQNSDHGNEDIGQSSDTAESEVTGTNPVEKPSPLQQSSSNSSDISEKVSAASTQPVKSLPQISESESKSEQQKSSSSTAQTTSCSYLEPLRNTHPSSAITIVGDKSNLLPVNISSGLINFSEFERECDPFERAELQTLNDMQELAAVFPHNVNVTTAATLEQMNTNSRVGQQPLQTSKSQSVNTTSNSQIGVSNPGDQINPQYSQASNTMAHQMSSNAANPYNSYYSVQATSIRNQHPVGTFYNQGETLKSSKSVGDLMIEIQKETENMTLDREDNTQGRNSKATVIRKSRAYSQTPPPSKGQANKDQRISQNSEVKGRNTALEDWIPWPDIDGLQSTNLPNKDASNPLSDSANSANANTSERASSSSVSNNPLKGLSQESAMKCKQIHDMGFPLERLGKACKSLGDDDQQMINYCLLVDKLMEDSAIIKIKKSTSNYSSIVEDVVLMHSLDESKSRKHLESFSRLVEFGFETSKTHRALIECSFDHEKALEQLLK